MQQSQISLFEGLAAGIDEAGRGPLAGPVVAAAVILDAARPIEGLRDSKKLTASRREALAVNIRDHALCWSVAWADAAEIDRINILEATMLAMRRAILGLRVTPECVKVDGNRLPSLEFFGLRLDGQSIVGGDDKVAAISAASILAKVRRDQMMAKYDEIYPGYGFSKHKGYGTAEHRARILELGPCLLHRRSFEPVRSMCS